MGDGDHIAHGGANGAFPGPKEPHCTAQRDSADRAVDATKKLASARAHAATPTDRTRSPSKTAAASAYKSARCHCRILPQAISLPVLPTLRSDNGEARARATTQPS